MAAKNHIPQRDDEVPKEKYLNKYVRDKVCASEYKKWRDLAIELLDDDDDAVAALDATTHNMDEKQCCSVMFRFWLERQPQATWKQLVDALYEVKLNWVAADVENLLIQSKTVLMGCRKQKQIDSKPPKRSQRVKVDQPQNQEDDDESIKRKFRGHTLARLNGRYANAVHKIKDIIEQKGYEINELLSNLNHIDTDNSTIFSTPNAPSKMAKIDDIFSHIGTHCNIYNYDLLIAFLNSIDCKEALNVLDRFDKEVQNSVLKELDLLSEVGEPQDPMPGSHTLVIKYIGNKCTLETEKLIRNVICECFHLKPWSVTFLCVQDGCIALVYQISTDVKSHILQCKTTATDVASLKKSHIRLIKIDNEVLEVPSRSEKIPSRSTERIPSNRGEMTIRQYHTNPLSPLFLVIVLMIVLMIMPNNKEFSDFQSHTISMDGYIVAAAATVVVVVAILLWIWYRLRRERHE